jgi:CheY-like chemotaxis protein
VARILIADDDEQLRGLLRLALEAAGHQVMAAPDGGLALVLASLFGPELFLCDLFMAEVDGLEAIGRFRAAFPGVPIVAMSGAAFGGQLDLLPVAKTLGAERQLAKPFSVATLLSLVEELLPAVQEVAA